MSRSQNREKGISRRSFLRTGAVGALGATTIALAAGCSPQAASSNNANSTASNNMPSEWSGEFDFIVVGSGTAIVGALMAAQNGASVAVVEKGSILGGTTRLSGAGAWVPGNTYQIDEGYGEDLSKNEILEYMESCDLYHGSTRETKQDYVDNCVEVFDSIADSLGFKWQCAGSGGDYTGLPNAKASGRSLSPANSEGEGILGEQLFADIFIPEAESLGVAQYLNTAATKLILDDKGSVIGIEAQGNKETIFLKANKGVLLGAGGFERDDLMRKAFLQTPVYGSLSVLENTGDGHKMGMAIGARLENMSALWQCPFYVLGDGDEMSENTTDWGDYCGMPGAIMVNKAGKRFTDESAGYAWSGFPFSIFDPKTCSIPNLPAYMIFDAGHVALAGWPNFEEEKPEWVAEYQTLQELAIATGIDQAGLENEVARYNGFCETGVDEDFDRGKSYYTSMLSIYMEELPNTPNPWLGKIETAPFYVVQIGPGTLGTCGGLKVDTDARVMGEDGEPITGLYACGNNASNVFGSAYPGATATTGQGYYRAFRAANHALGLNLV